MSVPVDILGALFSALAAYGVTQAELQKSLYKSKSQRSRQSSAVSDAALRVALSRLKKRGLVECRDQKWKLSVRGRAFIFRRLHRYRAEAALKRTRVRNLVVMFDIPEKRKNTRDWLRTELIYLGFIMLQESVWIGPAPLREEFVELLRATNVLRYMKFFEAQEKDII